MGEGEGRTRRATPMQRRSRVAGGRPNRHNVRLTDAEQEEFTAAAKAAGVTVPYLMVEHTRAGLRGRGRMSVADMLRLATELDAVWRQMHRDGVGLDQIAAGAKAGVVQGQDAVLAMRDRMARSLDRVDRVLDFLDPEGRTAR
ncbi:hypothetical protein Ppa06_64410 [Planomonospora parontospora subsp. parontospora]|uniref:Uncharacterized protein n=2 Tax=Planomonospora parontospora TaxID=58119 RepID=A0AA37F7M7_9ACTN|nr:hypothetical protein [Planomonospora parontospora]GGK94133.1 hypothetical protein GCM10010126_61870 [Planomonospora parontospora]GII12643.1 hypothetical protein Ppa06_64410 [Planomonospora parontospora subsp. parontospora]